MTTLEDQMRYSMRRVARGGKISPRDAGRCAGILSKRFYRWPKHQPGQRENIESVVKHTAERMIAKELGRKIMNEINDHA